MLENKRWQGKNKANLLSEHEEEKQYITVGG